MKKMMRKASSLFVIAVLAIAVMSCSEVNRETAPVDLIATIQQDTQVFDLLNPPPSLGTITLRSLVKRTDVTDTRFLDVQLKSYRVSYLRTDGGKTVPQPFVRATSGLIAPGGTQTLNSFVVFDPGALSQAPFAALLPQNGGIDPETGQRILKLDVIIDVFGETLAGDDVSARARMPLTFCAGCAA
jgi:hypothetical protein